MPRTAIACSPVSGVLANSDQQTPAWYADCVELSLGCFWEGAQSLPIESGTVRVGSAPEGLAFYLSYQDSDIFSEATADQQKMWTLGDVAELFIKPGTDRPDYWEIHVTPNDFLMDIYIPHRERFMGGEITWEEVIAPASGTQRRVTVSDGSWSVEALVPWKAFALDSAPEAGAVWQFAVCRYNCNGGLESPELSSTAHYTEAGFHRFEEFTDLVF